MDDLSPTGGSTFFIAKILLIEMPGATTISLIDESLIVIVTVLMSVIQMMRCIVMESSFGVEKNISDNVSVSVSTSFNVSTGTSFNVSVSVSVSLN